MNQARPCGAMVARLTPDQKVACSNHVRVNNYFTFLFFFSNLFALTSSSFSRETLAEGSIESLFDTESCFPLSTVTRVAHNST